MTKRNARDFFHIPRISASMVYCVKTFLDIYNIITSTKPNDWWAVADVDEFQVYNQSGWYGHRVRSDLSLNSVIKFCDENKY